MRADRLFFPTAVAWALVSVPLWVATLSGWLHPRSPQQHAHELLFGYGLLVVAGYLLGRTRPGVLAMLFCAWLAARVAPWWTGTGDTVAAASGLAFSFGVAALTAWPFLRAAKKVENRVFAPVLLAFFACDAAYQAGVLLQRIALQAAALSIAVDAFALLLAMMGGRVLPAAVAGHYYRQGRMLEERVQPALERTVIAAMLAMIACEMFPATRALAGACAIIAAAATALRAYRWRLWTVLDVPHLWSLGLGYAWLVPGLALKGQALLSTGAATGHSQHALTIGALGTMTLVMIGRTRLQRSKQPLNRFGAVAAAAVLLSVAALARLAAPALAPHTLAALWLSAFAWSAAFALLLGRLLTPRPREAEYS